MKRKLTSVQRILHPARYVRRLPNGVVRIVKDSYSNEKESWYDIRARVLTRDDYRCRATLVMGEERIRCPNSRAGGYQLEVHHIKELSRGGKSISSNLITLCTRCHAKRHRHL